MMERLLDIMSPRSPLMRALYRFPLLLWRMGLGWILPRSMLVLTTRGRRSGLPRHTMLEHFIHEGEVVIGSAWGDRAQWARNLASDAVVSAETWSGGVTRARARAITDEGELDALRRKLMRSHGNAGSQSVNSGALFWRMERADVAAPAPLARDLRWTPPLLLVFLVMAFVLSRGGVL